VSFFRILLLSTITGLAMVQAFHPMIPSAWDDREVETFEVPLAQPDRSPRLSAAEYYALEVMPIYRGDVLQLQDETLCFIPKAQLMEVLEQ
jgi:hypothetical protein